MRLLLIVFYAQVVGQRPGLGIKNRTLVFFVVIRRIAVDREKRGQGQQAVFAQQLDIFRADLPQLHLFFVNVGVLVKLRQSLVEPEGQPLCCFGQQQVRVLMVDDGVGVFPFGIQAHQDIVFVGGAQKKPTQLQLAFRQVGGGFQGAKVPLVADGQDNDG